MSSEEVLEKVKGIIVEQLGVAETCSYNGSIFYR